MGQRGYDSDAELARAKLAFVKAAMQSLAACAVRTNDFLLRRWFVRAFNHWYCPAVQTGYRGAMAPVFDLGMILCERTAAIHGTGLPQGDPRQVYTEFVEGVERSPLLGIARNIRDKSPEDAQPEVERILVESMVHALAEVWSELQASPLKDLSWLEAAEGGQAVDVFSYHGGELLGRLPLVIETARENATSYPRPADRAAQVPGLAPLFVAYVAAQTPNPQKHLDFQVVGACLQAPNKPTLDYDPPPLHRTETIKHTRSILPGTNAGVTRAEVKLPEDPLISILPSELAVVKAWDSSRTPDNRSDPSSGFPPEHRRSRGLLALADIVLNRKPLVYKRENPRDLLPRHRALVCFVTGAGAEGRPEFTGPGVHKYSHAYVWAKRQAFDLIRDLREALEHACRHAFVDETLEHVRRYAPVDVDVAVFGVRQKGGDTVVHSKFDLRKMPLRRSREVLENRIEQAMAFDNLVPGFFDLLPEGSPSCRRGRGHLLPGQMVDPLVGTFLRHEAQSTKPYHAVHLVLVGSVLDLQTFLSVVGRHSGFEMRSRQSLTLIGVDMSTPDADEQLARKGETSWLCLRSRTISEASTSLNRGQLPKVALQTLRSQFVESVMGRTRQRGSSVRHQVRLA